MFKDSNLCRLLTDNRSRINVLIKDKNFKAIRKIARNNNFDIGKSLHHGYVFRYKNARIDKSDIMIYPYRKGLFKFCIDYEKYIEIYKLGDVYHARVMNHTIGYEEHIERLPTEAYKVLDKFLTALQSAYPHVNDYVEMQKKISKDQIMKGLFNE